MDSILASGPSCPGFKSQLQSFFRENFCCYSVNQVHSANLNIDLTGKWCKWYASTTKNNHNNNPEALLLILPRLR